MGVEDTENAEVGDAAAALAAVVAEAERLAVPVVDGVVLGVGVADRLGTHADSDVAPGLDTVPPGHAVQAEVPVVTAL